MRALWRITTLVVLCCLGLLLGAQAGCDGPREDGPARLLETARRAFLDSQYLRAETAYEHYLQAYPAGSDRLEAWRRLADIALDFRESPDKAATLLEAAVLEFAGDPATKADLLTTAASLRFDRKAYARVAADCRDVVDLAGAPDEARLECHLLLARAELAQRNESQAFARYEACRRSDLSQAASARCALAQAELLLRLERVNDAEPLLQELFVAAFIAPALRAQAGFALGQIKEASGDKAAAREVYKAVRPLHPNPLVVDKRLELLDN
ncbi:MAG TPA: hypothetical protein PKC79_12560 [Solidesulfovibrio magneticus]|nr:hypothetical protein [Solidesulfovibrio magneticus]